MFLIQFSFIFETFLLLTPLIYLETAMQIAETEIARGIIIEAHGRAQKAENQKTALSQFVL